MTLAPDMLGRVLVHASEEGVTSGVITETEAYCGPEDKAAHTYNNRRTARTEVIFGDGGFAYVYMIYGMHHCFNVTANVAGKPECVLVRALEPAGGLEVMTARRGAGRQEVLCSGPGRLCRAMGITRELWGEDLCGERLYVLEGGRRDFEVEALPRVGIDYAEEYRDVCWRFRIKAERRK